MKDKSSCTVARALVIAGLILFARPGLVADEFMGLSFVGFEEGMSSNGTYICGVFYPLSSGGNTTAFLWTAAGGIVNLGLLPGSSTLAYNSYT
jgi:hypothetical protein